jgi:GT2 family glycosyltransferase
MNNGDGRGADRDPEITTVDLSLIVVNWNAKEHILHCLQSIVDTAGSLRTETIVVDNGSRDGSVNAIRSRFPWVKIIENKDNLGFAKANNIGIRISRGKYVCMLNSDVVVLDGCFRILHGYLEKHPRVGIVGPKMLDSGRAVRRSTMSFPGICNNAFHALALDSLFPKSRTFGKYLMACRGLILIQEVDILNGFFWLIRREALNDVGLLDERFFFYGEDIDLCKRFERGGWLRIYHPGAAAIHYEGASSARQPLRFFIQMQKANLQYWKKYYGAMGAFAYKCILLVHHTFRLLGYSLKYVQSRGSRAEARFKKRRSREALNWLLSKAWVRYQEEAERPERKEHEEAGLS